LHSLNLAVLLHACLLLLLVVVLLAVLLVVLLLVVFSSLCWLLYMHLLLLLHASLLPYCLQGRVSFAVQSLPAYCSLWLLLHPQKLLTHCEPAGCVNPRAHGPEGKVIGCTYSHTDDKEATLPKVYCPAPVLRSLLVDIMHNCCSHGTGTCRARHFLANIHGWRFNTAQLRSYCRRIWQGVGDALGALQTCFVLVCLYLLRGWSRD
jgi:hypothetical protein